MEAALRSCSIVVVVLTPDFVRSTYCMRELHWALHPAEPHPAQLQQPAAPAMLQPAADSAHEKTSVLQQTTQQRSKQPPLLLPVFYQASDTGAMQQEIQRQIADAYKNHASPAELQRLQQASSDLAAVSRITGNRLDSQGK